MVRRPAVRPIPRFCTEQCVLEILSPSCESSVTIRLVPALQKLLPFTVPSSRVVVTASSRRRRAVVRSSPPRRPATRPRRDRVVAGLHLPHQRHRRPSSPHPSASPRRRIPPRGRRPHAAVSSSPRHLCTGGDGTCVGWHLTSTSEHVAVPFCARVLLSLICSRLECRVVPCACFAPRRPRRVPPCRALSHLVVVHLGRHLVVHLLCTRHSWVMHQQGTGPAPAARVALSPPRRRRVVTSSSHRHRVVVVRIVAVAPYGRRCRRHRRRVVFTPSLPPMGSSPRRFMVASSSSPRHRRTASPRYRPTVSPTLSAVSPAILTSLLASILASLILTRLGSGVRQQAPSEGIRWAPASGLCEGSDAPHRLDLQRL